MSNRLDTKYESEGETGLFRFRREGKKNSRQWRAQDSGRNGHKAYTGTGITREGKSLGMRNKAKGGDSRENRKCAALVITRPASYMSPHAQRAAIYNTFRKPTRPEIMLDIRCSCLELLELLKAGVDCVYGKGISRVEGSYASSVRKCVCVYVSVARNRCVFNAKDPCGGPNRETVLVRCRRLLA